VQQNTQKNVPERELKRSKAGAENTPRCPGSANAVAVSGFKEPDPAVFYCR